MTSCSKLGSDFHGTMFVAGVAWHGSGDAVAVGAVVVLLIALPSTPLSPGRLLAYSSNRNYEHVIVCGHLRYRC